MSIFFVTFARYLHHQNSWGKSNLPWQFQPNPPVSFCAILLTKQQILLSHNPTIGKGNNGQPTNAKHLLGIAVNIWYFKLAVSKVAVTDNLKGIHCLHLEGRYIVEMSRYWKAKKLILFAIHKNVKILWFIKMYHFYFLTSSVKHWQILIIFGMQHQEKLLQMTVVLATSP